LRPDAEVVARQIGRTPRGTWRVVSRCEYGFPRAIAVAPLLAGGAPFPTTFWLTCPHLVTAVHALESAGEHRVWAQRAASDSGLASRLRLADAAYRAARRSEGGGTDPCETVGVAGQADPLAVKCLHARVAAALAGIGDPIGEAVLGQLESCGTPHACDGSPCGPAVAAS